MNRYTHHIVFPYSFISGMFIKIFIILYMGISTILYTVNMILKDINWNLVYELKVGLI